MNPVLSSAYMQKTTTTLDVMEIANQTDSLYSMFIKTQHFAAPHETHDTSGFLYTYSANSFTLSPTSESNELTHYRFRAPLNTKLRECLADLEQVQQYNKNPTSFSINPIDSTIKINDITLPLLAENTPTPFTSLTPGRNHTLKETYQNDRLLTRSVYKAAEDKNDRNDILDSAIRLG